MEANGTTIIWFRQDLRLQDNPALNAALQRGGPMVPVYVLDDDADGRWPAGGASRWWLHHSLAALDAALRERGSRLVLVRGESGAELTRLRKATGANAVYWNRCYEPARVIRDKALKVNLVADGLEVRSFNSALLFEPPGVEKKTGGPFQVFTPFWRHCQTLPVVAPSTLPKGNISAPAKWPKSLALEELQLRPTRPWADGFSQVWQPGETGAAARLKKFVRTEMAGYADQRNRPDQTGTSALSPHLHFGEISPRQIWAAVRAASKDSGVFPVNRGAQVFLSEIGWREFAYHLLYHFPQTPDRPLRENFTRFPWRKNAAQLRAWQQGWTGYPIVDAGMRQLWATGWMHNRVRMIVASFLVKHLRISWQAGAEWFWDTLVDADLASNTLGWQWSAGCGADAAPYFRVFNPILQGEKFDPAGDYVRKWVPELGRLSAKFIHQPWMAPPDLLARADVVLGRDYPQPLVDHGEARMAALAAFKEFRGQDR